MISKFLAIIKKRENLAILILAVILSFLIFGNGLGGDFVFDDTAVVKNRGDLKDSSYFLNLFVSPYHQNMPKTGLYRPFTMASYAINHYLGGSAFGFHLVNILIHALNSFLVFWLISYFLKSRAIAYASFFLFLAHPIHTEAVTSIVGRAELWAFFWSIITVYFFVKNYKLLAGLSFLLALWSKETALILLPAFLYLELYFGVNRTEARGEHPALSRKWSIWPILETSERARYVHRSLSRLLFLAIPLGIYSFFRYLALGKYFVGDVTTTIVENQLKFAGFSERIFTALKVLTMYVERLVWPVHLSADYSYRHIAMVANIFKSSEAIIGLFLLGGLVYSAIHFRKRALGFGAMWFLFPYLMISNLIQPVGTIMGERLMYWPSLGFVVLLAWLLKKLFRSPGFDIFKDSRFNFLVFHILLVTILVFYGARTVVRNNDWKDSRTLFSATVKESPNSLITRTALAGVHIRADEWAEAKKELEIAKGIYEDNSHLQNLLGIVADHEGNPELAEKKFLRSIELNQDAINSYTNLAELYLKYGEYEQAAASFLKVIEFYPVAEYLIRYAYAEIAINQPDEAIRVLQKYAGGNLKHPDFSVVIGTAYFVKGDYEQALIYLRNAKQLGNKLPEVEQMIESAERKLK